MLKDQLSTKITENSRMRNPISKVRATIFSAFLVLGFSYQVSAGIITLGANSYEVSYDFNVAGFTRSGGDVKDLFIFEWNESGDFDVDFAYSLAGGSSTKISQVIDFNPTSAFAIGYSTAIAGVGDEKDHIFTFTNASFAYDAVGSKWSEIFPGITPASGLPGWDGSPALPHLPAD